MKTITRTHAKISVILFAASLILSSCASSSETVSDETQELALDGTPTQEKSSGSNGESSNAGNGNKANAANSSNTTNSSNTANLSNTASNAGVGDTNAASTALNNSTTLNNLGALPEGLNGTGNTFDPSKQQNTVLADATPTNNQLPLGATNNSNKVLTNSTKSNNTAVAAANVAPPPNNSAPQANNTALPNNSAMSNSLATNNSALQSNTFASAAGENAVVPPLNATPESIPTPATTKPTPLNTDELEYWKQAAQKLRNLTPEETPSEYTVQSGDTLWDIADQLVDDYQWWPKLWVINSGIANPHLIYPGQRLVFLSSSGTDAPALLVRDLGTATPIPQNAGFITQMVQARTAENIDGELLDASQFATDNSIETVGELLPPTSFVIQIPGFLSDSTPDTLGKIVVQGDRKIVTAKDKITYGEFDNAPQPGQRFLAIREAQRGIDPSGNLAFGPDLYLYTGVVGVVKTHRSGVVSLMVEESLTAVMEDDLLIPFSNIFPIVESSVSGNKSGVRAKVLSTSAEHGMTSEPGKVVLLKREDGSANPGDLIDLYMPAGGMINFDGDDLDPVVAARARVLETKGDSISAVILSNTREVSVGAKTWPDL